MASGFDATCDMRIAMSTRGACHFPTILLAAVTLGAVACSTATPPGTTSGDGAVDANRTSLVTTDGYVTAGPWMGFGFTATDPGAATIVPACSGATCEPAFTGHDFCMHGTVTGRADYTGFAMLGWNVNQAATAGAPMDTWPVPASGGVTVTVTNIPPATTLRLQLQGTDPHSPTDRWCAPLISGHQIRWTDFKTNCYTGGSPQTPLAAGAPIQQAAVLVPGLPTTFPFDVCLIDIAVATE